MKVKWDMAQAAVEPQERAQVAAELQETPWVVVEPLKVKVHGVAKWPPPWMAELP